MSLQAKSMNAKLIIIYMPTEEMLPAPNILLKAIEAAQDPETLFFIDTYPAFRELVHEKGLEAVFVSAHPCAEGHLRIAEAIIPIVSKLVRPLKDSTYPGYSSREKKLHQ